MVTLWAEVFMYFLLQMNVEYNVPAGEENAIKELENNACKCYMRQQKDDALQSVDSLVHEMKERYFNRILLIYTII